MTCSTSATIPHLDHGPHAPNQMADPFWDNPFVHDGAWAPPPPAKPTAPAPAVDPLALSLDDDALAAARAGLGAHVPRHGWSAVWAANGVTVNGEPLGDPLMEPKRLPSYIGGPAGEITPQPAQGEAITLRHTIPAERPGMTPTGTPTVEERHMLPVIGATISANSAPYWSIKHGGRWETCRTTWVVIAHHQRITATASAWWAEQREIETTYAPADRRAVERIGLDYDDPLLEAFAFIQPEKPGDVGDPTPRRLAAQAGQEAGWRDYGGPAWPTPDGATDAAADPA